ncbi:MAG: 23S rRNA (adenine(2503)-C(2))-methyltransferase RlmN [Holosporales bacterium]|nr:23S rRNA (adenine(2503)-C(2))-methyltransferase RlmN [Holosporales bacterium]
MKKGILNITRAEFEAFLQEREFPKFRAKQVFSWLYKHNKASFFEMSNIGAELQNLLDSEFYIYRPKIVSILTSVDGTTKLLLELENGSTIETVYIPTEDRNTICVSSQVGCPVGCKFCNTGYNGFTRNLSAEEIIGQYFAIRDYLGDSVKNPISNIVFMGMGEPLLNVENVLASIDAFSTVISARKITLSTAGISNVLSRIAPDLKCKLAISLHAPNDKIRSSIMPINDTYNIESIIDACKIYYKHHGFLKITFEYLMLDGINDSEKCASELVTLIKDLNAKVNILAFNLWNGCHFIPSSALAVRKFVKILEKNGIEAPIRISRGRDIMAACGQLQQEAGHNHS